MPVIYRSLRCARVLSALASLAAAGLGGCDESTGDPERADLPDAAVTEDTQVPNDANNDPCVGVPAAGRCVGAAIERCVTPTGSSTPFVALLPCGPASTCAATAAGPACVPTAQCPPGASECHGDALAVCDARGLWQETTCGGGCKATPLGAACRPAIALSRYVNDLTYEYRAPNEQYTDWSPTTRSAFAQRLLIISFANGAILDATFTDSQGHFELDAVPAADEDGDDFIAAFASTVDAQGRTTYAVVAPGLSPGRVDSTAVVTQGAPAPQLWRWTWTRRDVPDQGGVYIALTSGAGAAFVYDYLRYIHDFADGFFGPRPNAALAVWFGFGVDWTCGACFYDAPAPILNIPFYSQAFIPGGADEAFWSAPVLAHELGHWLMATYGTSPGEGGPHMLGVPSHPGLAWSEGFATWFSDLVRGEGFYYDKQRGVFFFVDHRNRWYSSGVPWPRPEAAYGLDQLIDESEVTRMLLGLTTEGNVGAMLAAIASPRMNVAPFLRGYLRRTWDGLDGRGLPLPAWSTRDSAPHLADFLDAVVCSGAASPAEVDTQTEPTIHYPFPSRTPLCRAPGSPLEVSWADDGGRVTVSWHLRLDGTLTASFAGQASPALIVPPGTAPGSATLAAPRPALGPTGAAPEAVLDVHVTGEAWRASGRVARTAPPAFAPAFDGPQIPLQGLRGGPSIQLELVPPSARAPRSEGGPFGASALPAPR